MFNNTEQKQTIQHNHITHIQTINTTIQQSNTTTRTYEHGITYKSKHNEYEHTNLKHEKRNENTHT